RRGARQRRDRHHLGLADVGPGHDESAQAPSGGRAPHVRLALGHRSVRRLVLLLVGLLTLWSVAGFFLARQLASRQATTVGAALARLPTRAALVVVSSDRALGSTLAGAPTQGWEAVVRAGQVSIKGESWILRPIAEAGGSLWALVSEREHHGESRRLWFWWAV